jgi:pyruvate dehydrogenase E2 component (dihydrolipoamide acetyltransferase)
MTLWCPIRTLRPIRAPGETIAVGALLVRVAIDRPEEPAPLTTPATDGVSEPSRRTPTLVGYGPDEGPSRRRQRARSPEAPVAPPAVEAGEATRLAWAPARTLAKPPVRKRAAELGVDLETLVPGSGPDGVITRADVEGAAGAARRAHASAAPTRLVSPSASAVTPGEVIPVQGVRARIAERMTRSRSTIPDAGCGVTVDCGRLLDARALVREVAATRLGADVLTPFALILRAVVMALHHRPIVNATYEEDDTGARIKVHDEIHLGIGTDTSRGLLVPVVRNAGRLSTLQLAVEVRRLADGARAGTLAPTELMGSTFTVSNFGVFGLDEGYPVINHPEVAILGVGAIKERPVVVDGSIVSRPTAMLTCAFDHRACDGADVGAFLGRIRELVEAPGELILDR